MLSNSDVISISSLLVSIGVLFIMIFTYKRDIKPEKEVSDILATELKSLRNDVDTIKRKLPIHEELKRMELEERKTQNSWKRLMDLGKLAKAVAPYLEDNDDD